MDIMLFFWIWWKTCLNAVMTLPECWPSRFPLPCVWCERSSSPAAHTPWPECWSSPTKRWSWSTCAIATRIEPPWKKSVAPWMNWNAWWAVNGHIFYVTLSVLLQSCQLLVVGCHPAQRPICATLTNKLTLSCTSAGCKRWRCASRRLSPFPWNQLEFRLRFCSRGCFAKRNSWTRSVYVRGLLRMGPWLFAGFFPGGATSKFCSSFSGCWRCNASGRSQNALPVLYPISLCWLDLNSQSFVWIFFALRLSEMLFLFTNCRISIFRALSTNTLSDYLRIINRQNNTSGEKNKNVRHSRKTVSSDDK